MNANGKLIRGTITKRVGGGLNCDPKWRLSTWSEGGDIPDYNALELREIMDFPHGVHNSAASALRDIPTTVRKPTFQALDKHFINKSEEWSSFRFNQFDLLHKKVAKSRTQEKEFKFDERMIHLSTGVFENKEVFIPRRSKRRKSPIRTSPAMSKGEMIKELSLSEDSKKKSKIFDYVELQPFARVVSTYAKNGRLKSRSSNNDVNNRPKRKMGKNSCLNEDFLSSFDHSNGSNSSKRRSQRNIM